MANKTYAYEEATKKVLQQVIPECREVASNFFKCLEPKIAKIDLNSFDIGKGVDKNFVQDCQAKFNIDECLEKFEKQYKN
jgi:hypothetical protein